MTVIELGCGNAKTPGAFGIDFNINSQADLIHNLDVFPYPLQDEVADEVICRDVLEHLEHFVAAVEEIWRICKPGALVEITGPFMSSVNFYSDPTHKRAFTSRTFDYFIEGTEVRKHRYSTATFELVSVEFDPDERPRRRGLRRWVLDWANNNKRKYEERYAFMYPVHTVHFILRAIKPGVAGTTGR